MNHYEEGDWLMISLVTVNSAADIIIQNLKQELQIINRVDKLYLLPDFSETCYSSSQDIFCNADEVQKNCRKEWCMCVHRYQINLGDLVELIILDHHAFHPMHLHGHTFRVVGSGKV